MILNVSRIHQGPPHATDTAWVIFSRGKDIGVELLGASWQNPCLRQPWSLSDLRRRQQSDNLVRMTRIPRSRKSPKPRTAKSRPGHWLLQDAKARFSELVRRVRSDGPQHVTVHGRDEVVVIAAEEFRRLRGDGTGRALIEAIQTSPHREIDLNPERLRLPVRRVTL